MFHLTFDMDCDLLYIMYPGTLRSIKNGSKEELKQRVMA